MGGQVERDAQALLAGRQVAPVERVGLLGGREPGVLADRPRLGGVHRRVGPAQERAEPRPGVERVEALEVLRAVDRQDVDPLRARARARRLVPNRGICTVVLRFVTNRRGLPPPAAARRSSSGRSCQLLPRPGQEVERVDTHRAGVVDARGRPACRPGSPTAPRPRAGRPPGRRPTRRTSGRCRPGRRPAGRRTPPAPASTPSVAPASVDGDAAGGEQVGGERRPGGVRGDGAHGGEEDRRRPPARRAAPRSRRRTGGPGVVRVRLPLGQRLAEVRELADAGERPLAAGDLGVAARDDLVDPGRAASRRRGRPRRRRPPRSGRARPSRRRPGRR